jgi:raffinose/stachyose/melibiose transport system substrate-binding protein
MHKLVITIFASLLIMACDSSNSHSAPQPADDLAKVKPVSKSPEPMKQIILTMGSWRKDDVEQLGHVLKEFNKQYPHIVVKFDPTDPAQYNDVLAAQLEGGTAPDLYYLRSHSASAALYHKGYLVNLNELKEIEKNFPPQMRSAWTTKQGDIYGVPLMAVSHGIYYNASFFNDNNLAIPQTWEQLIALAQEIKDLGATPFANATGDNWMVNGLILQNLIPGFIGGEKGRLEYYSGKRCFNDDDMVAAFQAVADLSDYLSKNQRLLKYADTLQLFLQGKSPMLFGGSWDIPFFESQNPEFDWGVFAIPPPKGKEYFVTFHPDAAIGLNNQSQYIEEAKLFLQWITTKEFALLYEKQLPGFFPMHKEVVTTNNEHANMFLDLNKKYKTDTRIWRQMEQGEPSDYKISVKLATDVMNKVITAKQAADELQNGIAAWHLPTKRCRDD